MLVKNLFFYYLLIVVPLLALVIAAKYGYIAPAAFTWGIGLYALVYHPLVSGLRLVSLGRIPLSRLFYNLIPFWNSTYYKALFLGK